MLRIERITVEHQFPPVVTDNPNPRFSFSLESDRAGAFLRSAVITVNGWQQELTKQSAVYRGAPLLPFTNYTVTITAMDDAGEKASLEADFSTGRLGIPWAGGWISDPDYHVKSPDSPTPMAFRRLFTTDCPQSLSVFVTAMGIYDVFLDGKRLNEDFFSPGFTNYDADLQYTCYEVGTLTEGTHEFLAVVAGGWAVGRTTHVDNTNKFRSCITAGRQALLCELRLEDGTVLGSNADFEVTEDTPWRYADFYNGEIYDAGITLQNARWRPAAMEKLRVNPKITARYGLPVTEHERFRPSFCGITPSGERIYDFGQNIAGVVSFSVNAKAGQEIVIRHAEALENGELFVKNLRSARQELRYICKDGCQNYFPRFTYMGFRYVGIRGVENMDFSMEAVAVYSDLKPIGSFRCSNDSLNQLQSNLTWSGKDNFVDIPTDCPQRDERQGWTGDIALFAPTACFHFDMTAFLEKWLRDVASEQTIHGAIPFVVPSRKGVTPKITTSCWGDCCILVPWAVYQSCGDSAVLSQAYPTMVKYMADVKRWASLSMLFTGSCHILKLPFQFGDWCAPYGCPIDWLKKGAWIGTAYYYHSSRLMEHISAILGKSEESRRYGAQAEKIRMSFRRVFTDGKGRLKREFQSAYVLALVFDLAEGEERRIMADRLWSLIEENGIHLSTGFTATPYLLFALADAGMSDEAYTLLLQDTSPSWLYAAAHGATTLWEQWDAVQEDGTIKEASLNHYAYGAVGAFFHRRICGLEPIEPGYKVFSVKPVPGGGLTWAECEHHSPYGMIRVRWDREGERFRLSVTVPVSTSCILSMPDDRIYELSSGVHQFTSFIIGRSNP